MAGDRQHAGGAAVEVTDDKGEPTRTKGGLPDRELPEVVVADDDAGEHGKTSRFRKPLDDALAAATREKEEAQQATRAANERAETAERNAAAARQGATRTAVDERIASVDTALTAAKTAKDAAKKALRTAIEAGDSDAIAEAQEQIGTQSARIENLSGQKQWLDGEKERIKNAPAQTQTPSWLPAEQQWLNGHTLFESDPEYRAEVKAAATAAVERGMARGSSAYLKFIDERMTKMYGKGHGVPGKHGEPEDTTQRGEPEPRRQNRGAMGMPRTMSDEGESTGSGELAMDTDYGRVSMRRGPEGKPIIRMPAEVQRDWSEAATWSGMTLAEYAAEQLQIAKEEREGKRTGLTYDNSTRAYR